MLLEAREAVVAYVRGNLVTSALATLVPPNLCTFHMRSFLGQRVGMLRHGLKFRKNAGAGARTYLAGWRFCAVLP